jgi:hypothetical protein
MIHADAWKHQKYRDAMFVKKEKGPPFYECNSFSGSEPNRMFLNDGQNYLDISLVSGADHLGDGRGFAKIDFDNDGWTDIALVSTNRPRFTLLRNQLADISKNRRYRIKLRGGHSGDSPNLLLTNRDAIGAKVIVNYRSGRILMLHRQSGEGNVAQNSAVLGVGFQTADPIAKITVVWPTGNQQQVAVPELSEKRINVIQENASDSDTSKP